MTPAWAGTLALAALAAAVGLLVWPIAGAVWAWVAVCALLALRVVYHTRHMAALFRWLSEPTLRRLPRGEGAWEELLARLHGHLKQRDAYEQRLDLALARFRAAGRALPDGVLILDGENRIEWFNPTAQRHFDIDPRRDAGHPVTHLLRQPDFVSYLAHGRFEAPLRLRSARADLLLLIRVIEFGADQKLVNSRDITAEERLETMRRDFVANVSHELKTPVTVLSGFVETLRDESLRLSDAQRRRSLDQMSDQSRRLERLIEDLLTLSTLESSPSPASEQPVAMCPLIERLLEEARALSQGRHRIGATVETDALLTGDAAELHSAFSNLVSNAVRYTPPGGAIDLSWRLAAGEGVFAVRDSGIGIEARHLPRLTERFYRVDQSRSRAAGGTGLGLAIVKHALTRHDARLEVDSEVGRGSLFRAVFPALRIARGAQAPDSTS